MKNVTVDYHSCYDEMLSSLFLLSNNVIENKDVKRNNDSPVVSLVSKNNDLKQITSNDYNDCYNLTAHEIILYSVLLHKCIKNETEEEVISFSEIQKLRGKRVGKVKTIDDSTYKAYNRAFKGLSYKIIKYSLGTSRKNKKITYRESQHPLLIIKKVEKLDNNDKVVYYSLGKFGKTLIESKRYSTLIPSNYFKINFNEIMSYQLALYICRILYMERKKKRKNTFTIKLTSVMKNISKFVTSEEYGIIKYGCSLYYYHGENTKRYWDFTIKKVNELLILLKQQYKIKDYKSTIDDFDYQNIKWIIET